VASLSFLHPQAHAYIIGSLKEEMPFVFCGGKKKRDLIYDLPVIYSRIQQRHQIPRGDFPDCAKMQVYNSSNTFIIKHAHYEMYFLLLL